MIRIAHPPRNKQTSIAVSLPAPIGGWNKRDALADMDPNDAVSLINLFPSTTSVKLRGGYSQYSTGLGAQCETLISYQAGATAKMKAIAGGNVFDVTAGGAVGAAELTGLLNNRWQYVNITTPGGGFIEMCNGVDSVYTYNGTTWTDQSGNITGVTSSNLIGINVHKNRVWFIEKSTLKAWYLPVQSISGAAAALDLSAFAPHGGYLMAMGTWTIDAGYGVDDLAVFITSNGDAIVYRGTDPTSASTWALVGVWWLGSPVGRRCFAKWKGDMMLICQDGLLPLSGALQSDRLNPRVALTDKIQDAMSDAVTNYGANFGWQVIPFPKENAIILNVPITAGNSQQQYVMNTITGAWCSFQGWNANVFELFNDNLYFGGSGFVGKAWTNTTDANGAIFLDGLQAFNYFKMSGQQKRFVMMRPTLFIDSNQNINGNINVDFDVTAPATTIGTISFSGSTWDSGTWDSALWTDALSVSKNWQGANGIGYCGAPHLQANLNGANLQWVSTDIVMEPGSII